MRIIIWVCALILKGDWRSAVDSLNEAVRLNPSDQSAQTALLEAKKRLLLNASFYSSFDFVNFQPEAETCTPVAPAYLS